MAATPKVLLGTIELEVASFAPTSIVARLPANVRPGTYRVVVRFFGKGTPSSRDSASIDANLGAVGPLGPAGPQGPKGDIGPQGSQGSIGSSGGLWGDAAG